MWTTKRNNLLCSYLDAYEDQKKHIERVLSAKDTTRSTIPPYYPKFLKLKVCKYHMEEEKNEQIREENKILYLKIKDVIKKPSKYSKLFEPKKCPAFDKEKILLKRIKHEINNYQENIRFYHRIENANSFYPKKDLLKRKKELEENSKILQKSIFDISPNLMFSSPERIKNEIERYKNKRNKSAKPKSRPMTQQTTARKNNDNKINKNNTANVNKPDKEEEIDKKSEKNQQKSDQKNYNKINKRNGNIKTNNSNSKKLSRKTTETKMYKKNKVNENENDKNKRSKSTLKRNESEINLLG